MLKGLGLKFRKFALSCRISSCFSSAVWVSGISYLWGKSRQRLRPDRGGCSHQQKPFLGFTRGASAPTPAWAQRSPTHPARGIFRAFTAQSGRGVRRRSWAAAVATYQIIPFGPAPIPQHQPWLRPAQPPVLCLWWHHGCRQWPHRDMG